MGPGSPGKIASPLARRLARERGVDVSKLVGSGPGGRVVARDVLSEASATREGASSSESPVGLPPSPPLGSVDPRLFYKEGSYEEVQLDGMRRAIASRLTEAKRNIPHIYVSLDCCLDRLLAVRRDINQSLKNSESKDKVSVNDFMIKCAAAALMQVPDVNVSFAGDSILKHKDADVSVAVAIDDGLVTPIIAQANRKGLLSISREMRDLAQRAKARRLKVSEYEGGSFSISNMGMYGVKSFCAIVNPPQAAILAIGQGEERVVSRDRQIAFCSVVTVTLSCDHRAIDGALGARFLQCFREFVESPSFMLL